MGPEETQDDDTVDFVVVLGLPNFTRTNDSPLGFKASSSDHNTPSCSQNPETPVPVSQNPEYEFSMNSAHPDSMVLFCM